MRSIKYRGKVGTHWWYVTPDDESWSFFWDMADKETVGQFTGYKDSKGVEIYEGDKVITENEQQGSYPIEEHYEGVVTYSDENAWFCIVQAEDSYAPTLSNITVASIEVIGNIYENPGPVQGSDVC